MKKALIVGVDYYESIDRLYGCVNDSYSVKSVLERHSDGTINFDIKHMTASDKSTAIYRKELKNNVETLFNDDCEIALFYYSGHGHIETTGGYLITSECKDGDDGFSLLDLLKLANKSQARNRIIVIDSCHSGIAGNIDAENDIATIAEGVTILTASSATQYAMEENGAGVFTTLFVDALTGSAANLVGEISPGGVYAHIDQSLGMWQQRPIFKTNVKSFTVLREVDPPISSADLKRITKIFPSRDYLYKLDPSYEPERSGSEDKRIPPPNKENTEIFAILQKYNRINLVVPEGAPHMWHAAMNCNACKLTALGEHYWNLVSTERL